MTFFKYSFCASNVLNFKGLSSGSNYEREKLMNLHFEVGYKNTILLIEFLQINSCLSRSIYVTARCLSKLILFTYFLMRRAHLPDVSAVTFAIFLP